MDEQKNPPLLKRLWKNYGYLAVTVGVTLLTFGVILVPAYVPTGSMETTMPTSSFFIGLRLPYVLGDPLPKRGDVVMFDSVELGQTLVKRVIALPGETVALRDGLVYINEQPLDESYLPQPGTTFPLTDTAVFTVPEGCVFFLGDNRTNSLDSRAWDDPYVPLSQLRATALFSVSVKPGAAWHGLHFLPNS